jgi:tRNA U34 5-carboxymethylaminomethyl modifying GTPase MnmE/TrmE
LQCLSGDKIGLLETHFELIDENEDIHDISANDLRAVSEGVNPITGQEEQDIANRIFVYYCPDPAFPARLDKA